MGIAEELREKARSLRSSNDFVCKDFVASETGVKDPCNQFRRCCDCYADMFERIADRIDAERALPEGIDAERALPEGIEWPRFEDGELVRQGDDIEFGGEVVNVHAVTLRADAIGFLVEGAATAGTIRCSYGERVKRPTPKVLGADGAPIEVGDTVYGDDDPEQLIVDSFDGPGCVCVTLAKSPNGMLYTIEPSRLSHKRPDSWEELENYIRFSGITAGFAAEIISRAKALAKAGEVE